MPPSASIAKSIDSAGSGDVPSSQSSEDVFATVNVRNRMNVFEQPEGPLAQNIMPNGSANKELNNQVLNGSPAAAAMQYQQPLQQQQPPMSLQQQFRQQQPQHHPFQQHPFQHPALSQAGSSVPPSPFPGRKMSYPITAPGRAERTERADSLEDMSTTTSSSNSNNSISSKRKLPPLPQNFAHPDMMSTMQPSPDSLMGMGRGVSGSIFSQQSQQYSASTTEKQQNVSTTQQQQQPQQTFQKTKQDEEEEDEEEIMRAQLFGGFCNVKPTDKLGNGKNGGSTSAAATQPTNGIHGERRSSQPSFEELTQQQQPQQLSKQGPPPPYSATEVPTTNGKPIRPSPVPPAPPPKPGSSIRQRLSSSDEEYGSPTHSEDGRPKSNGVTGNGGGSSSSSSTTPTTTQSQIGQGQGAASAGGSKGSTPGTTPLGTPPPVPPRLERRPSQPSPSSSPPSMPPPVPPRLGRAAPVRTPSLDGMLYILLFFQCTLKERISHFEFILIILGREAFEVDCYTIKEENGEEDFLT